MRVSSTTQYISSTYNLNNKQNMLQRLTDQLSLQKRIVRPSDDPVASSQIVSLNQSLNFNKQMTENNKAVESKLAIVEGSLASGVNIIQDMKQLAVQAGNESLSDENRQSLLLQLREAQKSLVSLANSTDGQGNYVFAGTKTQNQPFTLTSNPSMNVSYQGDWQRQDVQTSSSRQLSVTEPGGAIFGTTTQVPNAANPNVFGSGNELLQSMKRFEDILIAGPSGLTPPNDYTSSIQAVMNGLDQGLNRITSSMASIGSRRAEAESLQAAGETLNIQYTGAISTLQDLDLSQAVSDFEMTKVALEASQKTFARISQLSLFNFI